MIKLYNSKIPPLTTEVTKKIQEEFNIKLTPETVGNYRKLLIQSGLISDPDRSNVATNVQDCLRTLDNFQQLDIIKEFYDKCEVDKVADVNQHVRHLYKICCALNIHPSDFRVKLENTQKLYTKFEQYWKQARPKETDERYRKAVRKFCHYGSFQIPKGDKSISGISDSQGDYSRVFLDDKEFDDGLLFFEKEFGWIWACLFGVNHEIFPRPETLYNWTPNVEPRYADVDENTYEYGFCTVFESKQNKYYDKLILDPRVLKLVKELPKGRPIITGMTFDKWTDEYANKLRRFYVEIGKIEPGIKYEKKVPEWLYANRPIYTMRHSAAMLWMQRTNFSSNLVAKMGWEDPKTLDKYYARPTVANLMEMGRCWYHNPPKVPLGRALFCSAQHAMAYYHKVYGNAKISSIENSKPESTILQSQ
jgi:hypothetical protein